MAEPSSTRRMTLEEFYAWAEAQEEPYEFVDGEPVPLFPEQDENGVIRAMAAGTWDHQTIIGNVQVALHARKPKSCRVGVRPRRSALLPPVLPIPPLSGAWVRRNAGISFSTSATLTAARSLNVSAPTTVVGVGAT